MELDFRLGTIKFFIKTYHENVYSEGGPYQSQSESSIINPNCSTDETLEGIVDSLIHCSLFIIIPRVGLACHIWAKFP